MELQMLVYQKEAQKWWSNSASQSMDRWHLGDLKHHHVLQRSSLACCDSTTLFKSFYTVVCCCIPTERRHTDGHCNRNLLWLLAGRLLFRLLPGLLVQCPDHNGADAVASGESSEWSKVCLLNSQWKGHPFFFQGGMYLPITFFVKETMFVEVKVTRQGLSPGIFYRWAFSLSFDMFLFRTKVDNVMYVYPC